MKMTFLALIKIQTGKDKNSPEPSKTFKNVQESQKKKNISKSQATQNPFNNNNCIHGSTSAGE